MIELFFVLVLHDLYVANLTVCVCLSATIFSLYMSIDFVPLNYIFSQMPNRELWLSFETHPALRTLEFWCIFYSHAAVFLDNDRVRVRMSFVCWSASVALHNEPFMLLESPADDWMLCDHVDSSPEREILRQEFEARQHYLGGLQVLNAMDLWEESD